MPELSSQIARTVPTRRFRLRIIPVTLLALASLFAGLGLIQLMCRVIIRRAIWIELWQGGEVAVPTIAFLSILVAAAMLALAICGTVSFHKGKWLRGWLSTAVIVLGVSLIGMIHDSPSLTAFEFIMDDGKVPAAIRTSRGIWMPPDSIGDPGIEEILNRNPGAQDAD